MGEEQREQQQQQQREEMELLLWLRLPLLLHLAVQSLSLPLPPFPHPPFLLLLLLPILLLLLRSSEQSAKQALRENLQKTIEKEQGLVTIVEIFVAWKLLGLRGETPPPPPLIRCAWLSAAFEGCREREVRRLPRPSGRPCGEPVDFQRPEI